MNQGYNSSYNYSEYTRTSYSDNSQCSYQNRDYWNQNYHRNTPNRKSYPSNQQTRSRNYKNRINSNQQQYSRSNYSCSNIGTTQKLYKPGTGVGPATVADGNNKKSSFEEPVNFSDISDAETVHLEDGFVAMESSSKDGTSKSYPSNQQTGSRNYKNRINSNQQQHSRSNYSCSNIGTTEELYKRGTGFGPATVSDSNNKKSRIEEPIDSSDLSEAETVHLEDEFVAMESSSKDGTSKSNVTVSANQEQNMSMYSCRNNQNKRKTSHTEPSDIKKKCETSISTSKVKDNHQNENLENINKQMLDNRQACVSENQGVSKDEIKSIQCTNKEKLLHKDDKHFEHCSVERLVDTNSALGITNFITNATGSNNQKQLTPGDMPLLDNHDDNNTSITTSASEKVQKTGEHKENFRKASKENRTTHSRNRYRGGNNSEVYKKNHKSDVVPKTDLKERNKLDSFHKVQNAKMKTVDQFIGNNEKSSKEDNIEKCIYGSEPKCAQSIQVQLSKTKVCTLAKSDALFTNEEVNKLNTQLANLENDQNSAENHLSDTEVEQIMCNNESLSENNYLRSKTKTRLRERGKSCNLHDRRQTDLPNLVRSKSLLARDFLCYTPFRVTRSISNNWLLTSGIDDGDILRTFDVKSNVKTDKPASIRKRRQTIGALEIPSKKPSLFSEQTPYVKPREIQFAYTPRYSDMHIEGVDAPEIDPNVTVIYNNVVSIDPRKKSDTFKININGRELVKYTDYVKANANLSQKSPTMCKDIVPKKISNRRKSLKDHDPDYVPPRKIVVTPRHSLTEESVDYTPSNKVQNTEPLPSRNLQISTHAETPTRKSDRIRRLSSNNKCSKSVKPPGIENYNAYRLKGCSNDAKNKLSEIESANQAEKNVNKDNANKELQLNRRNSTSAQIKHYNDVQRLSFNEEVCTPHCQKETELSRAVIGLQEEVLANADIVMVSSMLHKPEENVKQNSTASIQNSSNTLSAFSNLGDFLCIIKTFKQLQQSCITQFHSLVIPTALKTMELTIVYKFYDNRIRYWIKVFLSICEKSKLESCDAQTFLYNLLIIVRERDPLMPYRMFLSILNMIINTSVSVGTMKLLMESLKPFVNQQTQNSSLDQNGADMRSTNLEGRGQRPSNPVRQQTLDFGRNGARPGITLVRQLFSSEQLRILKLQMETYNKLVGNHNKLMSRLSLQNLLSANTRTNTKSRNQIIPCIQPLQQRQCSLNPNEQSRPKNPVSFTVPFPLTIAPTKRKDVRIPALNARFGNYNTSIRDPRLLSAPHSSSYPVSISVNDAPSVSTVASAVRSQKPEPQSSTENSARCPEPVLNVALQSNEINAVTPQADISDEIVDAECYFSASISNSEKGQNDSISNRSISHSSDTQGLSEKNEDLPPRTASNDSGMDSPSQVDSLVYENRICLCGKPAVYLCQCKAVIYCSEPCQRKDWQHHKQSYVHQNSSFLQEEEM
ncbi:hypothetical protein Trydic_g3386 [Trypoxylus dichotomus]